VATFKKICKKIFFNLLFWVVLAVGIGILVGALLDNAVQDVYHYGYIIDNYYGVIWGRIYTDRIYPNGIIAIVSIYDVVRSAVFFVIPLIIFIMITSSITKIGRPRIIRTAFIIVAIDYGVAIIFAIAAGFVLNALYSGSFTFYEQIGLPSGIFPLAFNPLLTMSASFILSLLIGFAILATKQQKKVRPFFEASEKIARWILKRFLMPLMPVFIGTSIAMFVWQVGLENLANNVLGVIGSSLGAIFIAQILFMVIIFGIASLQSRRNTYRLLKHYGGISLVAMSTMSSAYTMNVVMKKMRGEPTLDKKTIDFGVPFFANTSFYGTTIAVITGLMGTSLIVNGSLPNFGLLLVFSIVTAIFMISSPGIPGGAAYALAGVASIMFGFGPAAIALFLIIERIADPMSTLTNIASDGAALDALDRKVLINVESCREGEMKEKEQAEMWSGKTNKQEE